MNIELLKLVTELTEDINIKSKTETFDSPNHGSSDAEPFEIITYWNEYKCAWTDKETLMIDHIINKLKPAIKQVLTKTYVIDLEVNKKFELISINNGIAVIYNKEYGHCSQKLSNIKFLNE